MSDGSLMSKKISEFKVFIKNFSGKKKNENLKFKIGQNCCNLISSFFKSQRSSKNQIGAYAIKLFTTVINFTVW